MTGRGLTGKAAVAVLIVLLAGCAVNRPPNGPVTYKINNIIYPDLESYLAEFKRLDLAFLPQVTPTTQRLGGIGLVVIPTLSRVKSGYPVNPIMNQAAMESFVRGAEINLDNDGAVIERGHIFDTTRIVRADNPASVDIGDADYKLWVDYAGTAIPKWTLVARGGKSRELVLPVMIAIGRANWMNDLNIAVLNAAADLGAPVTRQAILATGPSGPTTGTAFFIDAHGHMLTNAHVVETCKSVSVTLTDGDTADAKIVAKDTQNDLALLVATTKVSQYARFAAAPPRQGDEVVVYGFPLPGALSTQGNLTTGIISALVGVRDDSRQFQISAPVQPGNSGGPLLDRNGAVIGVVSSKINALRVAAATGDVPQNVNFAIKANVVSNFLETNAMKFEQAPKGKLMDIADISERAKSYTYMITCTR